MANINYELDSINNSNILLTLSILLNVNGQNDEALNYLVRAIDMGYLIDISNNIFFESLYDHHRFQELVEKQKQKREEVMALVATYNFPEPEDL